MPPVKSKIPKQVVTNPIWLWLFRHGWEDPGWGSRTIDQHTLALAILAASENISDAETRAKIKGSASKLLLKTARDLEEESRS
jgi:hypothetical protein